MQIEIQTQRKIHIRVQIKIHIERAEWEGQTIFFYVFILHFSYVGGMGLGISGWYEVNIEHLSVLTANKYLHGEIAVPRNVVLGKGDMCVFRKGDNCATLCCSHRSAGVKSA